MEGKEDTASGAGLVRNDKWLVTNLLHTDSWASGAAADLLDGSAWRRFAERLGRLAERIESAAAPGGSVDRADGYRYLCTLIRNAFDVAIEEHDPDRPRIQWLTRRNKIGWDCPDALYGWVPVRDDAVYRLRGRRGNARFVGLQVNAGIRSIHNTHLDEMTLGADGGFELFVGGERRDPNWVPLGAGADTMWLRQFFYDWERESSSPLSIERIDERAGAPRSGILDPAFFSKRLDGVATNVEANVELWLAVAVAQRERWRNRFPDGPFGGSAMGAQSHQTANTCAFRVEPDEALWIEVRPPRAKYWSLSLCNFWLESLDYANHQSSLNGHQAVLDADGVFRAVVTHDDPGIANWLDPVGHVEGSMIVRWNFADSAPRPETTLLPRRELGSYLPADTPRVTPEARARTIEIRREHVRRRGQALVL